MNKPLTFHQLRGDVNKVHEGCLQGAADFPRGFSFHGLRCAVLTAVGWHLCMKVHFKISLKTVFLNHADSFAPVNHVLSPSFLAVLGDRFKHDTFQWNQ